MRGCGYARARVLAGAAALLCAAGFAARAPAQGPASDAVPLSARQVLDDAFTKRYEVDLASKIELIIRDRGGQDRRRVFRSVSKVIDGRVNSIGRLIWPEYVRGMTILTIESQGRSHDTFVFLPALNNVRRVTTAQRGDSFLGSDVNYEDIERRRVEEFELDGLVSARVQGEPAYEIEGRPLKKFSYERVVFAIAESDGAILETRYFKGSREEPYRVISAPREDIVASDGHVIPTRLNIQNHVRGTSTQVVISDLQINPPINDRVFSVKTLQQERKLPGFDGRAAPPDASPVSAPGS